jgi:hypothetical protein
MRQLAGMIVLIAVIGATIALRPSPGHRLASPETGASGPTEPLLAPPAPRLAFILHPLVAFHDVVRAPVSALVSSRDEAVGVTAVAQFAAPASGTRDARSDPSAPPSQAPTARFGTTPPDRLTSSKPADADARRELTRDLQRELKRVGCYRGDLDGSWGPETKRAMSAFTDRVNATLPVEEPDYILLALVRGHTEQTCGKSCPSGQELANDGRCLPRVIIARRGSHGADKSEERSIAAGQQPWPLRGAAPVPGIGREGMSAWRAAVKPSSGDGQEGNSAEKPPHQGRMAVGAATAGGRNEVGAASAADVSAEAKLASRADGPAPKAEAKHERLRSAHRSPVTEQQQSVAVQRQTRLTAAKRDRLAERPRKGRLSVARAPVRAYRAPSATYRTARRNAYRRALAAWWRRWHYAVYGGMAPAWR